VSRWRNNFCVLSFPSSLRACACSLSLSLSLSLNLIRHRLRLLYSFVGSTTGARNLPNGEFSLRLRLLKRPRTSSHDDRSDQLLRTLTLVSHPAPLSPDTPEYVSNAVRRNPFKPTSNARQLNAVIAQADRTHRLGSLALPCLIVHGSDDRLVPLAHGEATARAIGGDTRTLVIEGMGHVMTSDFYQQVIDAIVSNSKRTMGHDGLGER
jgi:pimeloyl-ACP methyl ester carboxylesterase